MIKTYKVVGFSIVEPYLNANMKIVVRRNPDLYDSMSRLVKLILVSEDEIQLKTIFYYRNNILYHKYSKKTNWYKFVHAMFRLKDEVKIFSMDFKMLEMFMNRYVSYNTITKKWVLASEKDVDKFKMGFNLVKNLVEYRPNVEFHLMEDVCKKIDTHYIFKSSNCIE